MQKNTVIKKSLCYVILIALVSVFLFLALSLNTVKAEEIGNDESDLLFRKTLEETLPEGYAGETVNGTKEVVYDKELKPLGYAYDFKVADINGYSINILTDKGWEVKEFALDAVSPYDLAAGKYIYLTEFNYAHFDNGYYLIGIDKKIDKGDIDRLFPKAYGAVGDNLSERDEVINYTNKSVSKHELARVIPNYVNDNLTNGCVPIAAANIVAYYDKTSTNLIKDYTPGNGMGNIYIFKKQNATIDSLIQTLADYMNLNSTGDGATIAEFKNGMNRYCNNNGYSVSYNNCTLNGGLDYNRMKENIESGLASMVFVSKMEIASVIEGSASDSYHMYYGLIDHVLSVFGYKEIVYTYADGSTEKKEYLLVATGIGRVPTAYLNINNNLIVDEAYIIDIK